MKEKQRSMGLPANVEQSSEMAGLIAMLSVC